MPGVPTVPAVPAGDEWLTCSETAELVRTSTCSLYRWRKSGASPRWTSAGRKILYRRSDVLAWLAERAGQR